MLCGQHAKMEVVGNTLILTDLRSCHGTFLNGKLLESGQKIVLIDLDDVRFGASTRSYILRKRGY
jgi:pSer/pThr/pTyr-binding forkhead associated (FHA) protein